MAIKDWHPGWLIFLAGWALVTFVGWWLGYRMEVSLLATAITAVMVLWKWFASRQKPPDRGSFTSV